MKSVIFFRHGKSDWDSDFERDFDRPLAKRGRKAAALMGAFLSRVDQEPDLIVISPAVRAAETVAIAAENGEWRAPVRTEPSLYEASVGAIIHEIKSAPDEVQRLMLVGHEPSWSDALGRLIGGAAVKFPTAAMARVDLDASSWHEADFGKGELIWLVTPKLLQLAME